MSTEAKTAQLAQFARVAKALGSPTRLELRDLLTQAERSVDELACAAGMPVGNTSAQRRALHAAGLVASRRHGTRIYLHQLGQVPDMDGVLGPVPLSRRLPVTIAGTGLRHLLIPVQDAAGLAILPMAAASIAELSRALHVDTIGVFAVTSENGETVSVQMRDLCAGIGATEEPASGTTSAARRMAGNVARAVSGWSSSAAQPPMPHSGWRAMAAGSAACSAPVSGLSSPLA